MKSSKTTIYIILSILFLSCICCICCTASVAGLILLTKEGTDQARENIDNSLAEMRNDQRSTDVSQILVALTDYKSRSKDVGELNNIPNCPNAAVIGNGKGNIDLWSALTPQYMEALPLDPSQGNANDIGYTVCRESTGRLTVSAPHAELGKRISVSF